METTYRSEVKGICRRRLHDFILQHFNEVKRRTAHVLCFPGPEALETFEVYERLGIAHDNIVCLECDRTSFLELKRRRLGIDLRNLTLAQFLATGHPARFDVVSLDFTGQIGSHWKSLAQLRGVLDDEAVVFTNFCGAREGGASRVQYISSQLEIESFHMAEIAQHAFPRGHAGRRRARRAKRPATDSIIHSIRDLIGKPTSKLRAQGMHLSVRAALTNTQSRLLQMVFAERNHGGGLSKEAGQRIDALLSRLSCKPPSPVRRELQDFFRKAAPEDVAMYAYFHEELTSSLHRELRQVLRRIRAKAWFPPRFPVEVEATLLLICLDIWLSRPFSVLASKSFRYVSNRSTPMYADVFRLRRDRELDHLGEYCQPEATRLRDLLRPLSKADPVQLHLLIESLCKRLVKDRHEAKIPRRIWLGGNGISILYRQHPRVTPLN